MPLPSHEIWGGTASCTRSHRTPHVETHVFTRAAGGGQGGDIHSLHVTGHDVVRLLVADVMGHGPDVARLGDWMYQQFLEALEYPDDCAVLRTVNERILERGHLALTTAVVLRLDREAGELSYANAGHPPILFHRDDAMGWRVLWQVEPGTIAGLPLGARPETEYFTRRATLEPGDRFIVVTDGLIDARAAGGARFGFDRLRAILQDHRHEPVEELFAVVIEAVTAFSNGHLDLDDITLVAVGAH